MPKNKAKTKKSLAKRVRVTPTGKIMYRKGFRSHLATRKSKSRLRRLSVPGVVKKVDAKRFRRALQGNKGMT